MPETIHQEVVVPAARARVYDALTKASDFGAFTGGAPAQIDARPGGAFSLFGGRITGFVLDVEPGNRLVQAWRAGNWDAGDFSIVRLDLAEEGGGTRITLTQSGHPQSAHEHLAPGWSKMYWEPLTAHLS
jgi:uncharacterized protein YndB with AHSA1/START domain